jgi:ketosteroid isomerase-like protein
MWFTDTPWPPIVVCVVIGAFLLYGFSATQRSIFLVGVAVLLGLMVGIYFIEQAVVTEAERIEANVLRLADAVKQGDVERTLSFLSPREDKMRARIAAALALYDIGDDMRITDLHVRMQADNSIGISHFRANGTIIGKASSLGGRGATRWELTWRRVEDDWKITQITRLHPIRNNETIDMFEQPN